MRRLWPTAESVGGIALAALEVAAVEVTIGLDVTDHGLDGGAAPELAFDRSEKPRFWPEMKTRRGSDAL
jgi:hypothetical protein